MSCCPFSTPTRCIPVASLPWGRQPIDQVKAPPRPHGCQRSRHKRPHAGPPPAPLAVIRLGQPLLPALVYEDASPGGRETRSGRTGGTKSFVVKSGVAISACLPALCGLLHPWRSGSQHSDLSTPST